MEIWIPVLVAIITSLGAFIGSVYKSKKDLKVAKEQNEKDLKIVKEQNEKDLRIMKEQNENELSRLREEHKNEIERMEKEFEKQGNLYEQNAQTDAAVGLMKDPKMKNHLLQEAFKQMGKQS